MSALPDSTTATPFVSDELAAYASESRSGSAKYGATSSANMLSTSSSRSPIVPIASGARFGTVTAKLCPASRPPGSRTVTVTVVVPTPVPVTPSMPSDTATVARVVSDEVAVYSRSSPSGSAKYAAASTTRVSSTWTSPSAIVSATTGARFGTVTAKLCVAARPSGSVAVAVTVVSPLASPVTVSTLPDNIGAAVAGAAETAA